MELFHKANAIRLKSHHDKYLVAEKDEESVSQDRKGKSPNTATTWNVELVQGGNFIRLKSCYGKYLTASDVPFHLGMAGKKVVQTLPTGLDDSSSLEWEPIRDNGHQFKLKSRRSGDYLRANGGLPPWRNSVTHDVPHRTSTQDWILWEVDILDMQFQPIVAVAKPNEESHEAKPKEKKEAKLIQNALLMKRRKEAKPPKEEKKAEEEGEGEGEEEEKESEESEESEEEGGEGSPNSKFGFRKFLHKLKGDHGEDQGEGEEEGEGEGGSPHSRFGFRKFLHELGDQLGGDGEEGEGEEVEFEFEF